MEEVELAVSTNLAFAEDDRVIRHLRHPPHNHSLVTETLAEQQRKEAEGKPG